MHNKGSYLPAKISLSLMVMELQEQESEDIVHANLSKHLKGSFGAFCPLVLLVSTFPLGGNDLTDFI